MGKEMSTATKTCSVCFCLLASTRLLLLEAMKTVGHSPERRKKCGLGPRTGDERKCSGSVEKWAI